jgi:hypothetical protein
MIRSQIWKSVGGLAGLAAVAFLGLAASGDGPPASQRNNNPLPRAEGADLQALRDVAKGVIERPTKKLVASTAATRFINPKVQPGKVGWHADFAAACAASAKSKKPVLLFQMMGKLDDQFC